MKRYVLMIAPVFPAYHPKAGQPTGFKEKILEVSKIHTIRANFSGWKKKIDAVNAGDAVLVLREWTGRPYRSETRNICTFGAGEVGIQELHEINEPFRACCIRYPGNLWYEHADIVAANDGLSETDFYAWFRGVEIPGGKPFAIIHFTGFRYFM